MTTINRRWIIKLIGESAFERLATELVGSDLHSVLLEIMSHRAGTRSPTDVLAQYQRDAFCSPASVDLRTSLAVDSHLLAVADGFEAMELSPVAPLAATSAMGSTGQNRVLSALRMTEVVSDPTNVLALECARRMRIANASAVHLVTSHRVLRTQPIPKRPGHSQHFRMFALASGGRELSDHSFSVHSVVRHIRTMLLALERLEENGYAFGARRIELITTPDRKVIAERIASQLDVGTELTVLEHAYYSGGLRYQIWVTAPDGAALPLVDGGLFDWLAKLTSNRRAVFVATGAGSQLIVLCFRQGSPSEDNG